MGKPIDSDALTELDRALGLTGAGTAVAELQDATVEQVMELTAIVRRSRTLAGTQGIFTGTIHNVHSGSGSLTTAVDPYAVTAGVIAPYTNPIPRGLDVWLYGCSIARISGTGTFDGSLDIGTSISGWGISSAGAGVTLQTTQIANWDTLTSYGGFVAGGLSTDLHVYTKIGLRLPQVAGQGTAIILRTTASAAATYALSLHMGLFPAGLGQDVAV